MSGLLLVSDCVPWWRKLVPAHWQVHCLVTWGMYQLEGPFPRVPAGGTSILSKTPKKKQTSWRHKIHRKRKTKNVQQPVRRISGTNTDLNERRRRKLRAGSPFLCFRVIQKGYWPNFNLESVFNIKILFILKNVTHFHKTMETGVDPRPPVASHWKLFTPFESDNLMKRLLQPTTT